MKWPIEAQRSIQKNDFSTHRAGFDTTNFQVRFFAVPATRGESDG
ncbi:hypothetical protein ACIPIX_03905 [Pseudomonas protegens]|nr:hypothetical protein [Pseudomonas protegens]